MKPTCLVATVRASVLFAVTLMGCSHSEPTGGLQGKITYRGEAVADATIQVQSAASGAAGAAKSDSSGSYKIATPLPTGKYTAIVIPFNEPVPAPAPPDYKPKDNPKIPQKYRDSKTSGFTFEIKPGENQFNAEMVD